MSTRLGEAVLSTHNLCFEQKYEKIRIFIGKLSIFMVKFSVYLNRCVFVIFCILTTVELIYIRHFTINDAITNLGLFYTVRQMTFELARPASPISYMDTNKIWHGLIFEFSTPLLLNTTCPILANSVDPDHLASGEANWSGSVLFVIKYVNFYQKLGSSNLIGWKLEVGVASWFIQQGKG